MPLPELQPLGRTLLLFGALVAGFGLVLLLSPKLPWLGRLMETIEHGIDRVHLWYGKILELAEHVYRAPFIAARRDPA